MKKWHLISIYGMWGRMLGTDLWMKYFTQQVQALGVDVHNSPYDDPQSTALIPYCEKIPADEGLFLAGTSLGACNIAMMANFIKRTIDGVFGFQASIYGLRGYAINANVKWAHLIYSYNPLPFPGLGAYKWPYGTIKRERYVRTGHHIPHPGDYDAGDRAMFLKEIRNIMGKSNG